MRIRVAGFSGIAVTTWAAGVLTTSGKSNVGARCVATSRKSERTARRARSIAGDGKDRRCCTGPTTRERSDAQH